MTSKPEPVAETADAWRFEHVFALREAAAQARWNIDHIESGAEPSLDYERHWRGTAVWLEKRAAAIERGERPDAGHRPAALACCDEHPFIPGALCRVVGDHELHLYDGVDPWTPNPNTKD